MMDSPCFRGISKGDHILLKTMVGILHPIHLGSRPQAAGATGKIARQRSLVSQKSPMKQVTKVRKLNQPITEDLVWLIM
jgi:hypothetical protein